MVGAVAVTGPTLDQKLAAALAEIESLRSENDRLRGLLGLNEDRAPEPPVAWEPTLFVPATPLRPVVDRGSSPADKIRLFRSLFAGRDDVYAVRWQNDRSHKAGWSPAVVGGWANSKRSDREYEPLTDAVIERHLAGEVSAGLYPLLRNDRCRLLACDFDGGSWALDALAYLDACRDAGLPAVLERSRSGDGGHVWVFFSGQVPAADARKVGAAMLRRAMASRVEIDLSSYDRLFPSQDVMPKGSFGNLIAFPCKEAAESGARPCSSTRPPSNRTTISGRSCPRCRWRARRHSPRSRSRSGRCRSDPRRSIGSRLVTVIRPRRWCTRPLRGCWRSSGSVCRHG